MAAVYRLGASGDVHAAIVSGDPDDPASPAACHFDKGGSWSPDKPEGPECYRCFAAVGGPAQSARRLTRKHAALGGSGALMAGVLAAFASQGGGNVPVATFGITASPLASFMPSLAPTFTVGPALTPAPTSHIPVPSSEPVPSSTARPPAPSPSPAPTGCEHPGKHLGNDGCKGHR